MPDGDRERIGGWLCVEHHDMPWNGGVSDPTVKIAVCGELGHARWNLFIVAWREACRRDLKLLLEGFAQRVEVEYGSASTDGRRETPRKPDKDNNGGNS